MHSPNPVFFIIGTPRSGTNHLCSMLGSHPEIACHNEVFHPDAAGAYLAPEMEIYDTRLRNRMPRKFLAELFRLTRDFYPTRRVFGAKLILSTRQIELGLEAILEYPGCRIIRMDRANRLARYSSEQIATQTGVWLAPVRPEGRRQVVFDPEAFEADVTILDEAMGHVKAETEARGIPCIDVDYAELSDPATLAYILGFLGCRRMPMTTDVAKLNPGRILDRFVNVDEVAAYFTARGQEAWFEE